jgi:hypothetical protein
MFEITLSLVIGCGLLIAAFTIRTFTTRRGAPLPLWFGRLICVVVGIVFLLSAFQDIRQR